MSTSPGTTNLKAWWPLDEASGNAIDAHGSNDLTDTNTVGVATGKVGDARDFELANTEYFTIADNTDLSTGDIDFSVGAWVYAESLTGDAQILSKWTNAGNQREYSLMYIASTGNFRFRVSSDGTTAGVTAKSATNFGTISTGVWYFVVGWHDAANNVIGISVNNSTAETAAHTTGVFNGTSAFEMGTRSAADLWDGIIDESFMTKEALTSSHRDWLYNGGNGRSYANISGVSVDMPLGVLTLTGLLPTKKMSISMVAGVLTLTGLIGTFYIQAVHRLHRKQRDTQLTVPQRTTALHVKKRDTNITFKRS